MNKFKPGDIIFCEAHKHLGRIVTENPRGLFVIDPVGGLDTICESGRDSYRYATSKDMIDRGFCLHEGRLCYHGGVRSDSPNETEAREVYALNNGSLWVKAAAVIEDRAWPDEIIEEDIYIDSIQRAMNRAEKRNMLLFPRFGFIEKYCLGSSQDVKDFLMDCTQYCSREYVRPIIKERDELRKLLEKFAGPRSFLLHTCGDNKCGKCDYCEARRLTNGTRKETNAGKKYSEEYLKKLAQRIRES